MLVRRGCGEDGIKMRPFPCKSEESGRCGSIFLPSHSSLVHEFRTRTAEPCFSHVLTSYCVVLRSVAVSIAGNSRPQEHSTWDGRTMVWIRMDGWSPQRSAESQWGRRLIGLPRRGKKKGARSGLH